MGGGEGTVYWSGRRGGPGRLQWEERRVQCTGVGGGEGQGGGGGLERGQWEEEGQGGYSVLEWEEGSAGWRLLALTSTVHYCH